MGIRIQTNKQWAQTAALGVVPLPGFTPNFHLVFHVI